MLGIIFAIIVGCDDRYVNVEEHKTVGDLQEIIKRLMQYKCPSHELTLYLAKTEEGEWLSWNHPAAAYLMRGEIPGTVKDIMERPAMDPEDKLSAFGFPVEDSDDDADDDDTVNIHILVDVPEYVRGHRDQEELDRYKIVERHNLVSSSSWFPFWPLFWTDKVSCAKKSE